MHNGVKGKELREESPLGIQSVKTHFRGKEKKKVVTE